MSGILYKISKFKDATALLLSFPWVVVLSGILLLTISNIYISTVGVFFKPVAGEFGWSRAAVSSAPAMRLIVAAIFAIPAGYFSDRYGPRKVVIPSFLLLGISFLLNARITTLWQLYLVQGLLLGIATSGPYTCIVSTVVKWHNKWRGLALGIVSAGNGLSAVIFPPLATKLMMTMGWRSTIALLGLGTLIIAVPVTFFIKNPKPQLKQSSGKLNERKGLADFWHTLPQLLKNRLFMRIVLVFFFFYIACYVITNHLINYLTDLGMSALVAAAIMSVVGVSGIIGRVAMGVISDRIGAKTDTIICGGLVIASLVLLLLKAPVLMWVAAALFGMGYGGGSPLMPTIIGEHFGTKSLATMTGAIIVGANFGAAIGPWMGGVIFDISQNYLWALVLSIAFTSVALVMAWLLPSVIKDSQKIT